MKSKGLAGIFDHDFAGDPGQSKKKSTSLIEIEAQAKRVAREAAKVLEESTIVQNDFEPTWTGNFGAQPRRFGGVMRTSAANCKGPSSKKLLSNLRRREHQIKISSSSTSTQQVDVSDEANHFAVILKRLQTFVMRKPTTDEILKEFDDVPSKDAAIFKRLLNSVAQVKNGRWCLKDVT